MSTLKVSSGRSTSQISVYDYPEHLNPFYEDENHKRIRFWRIGKHRNNGENSRRGSFTLSGLKDMWTFKSFRLKKRSSNLGINKTSESPPPLRKADNHYGTYDSRIRHTVGNNTLNDNFLRNVPYRASLQDMRFGQKNERNYNCSNFERNNRFRSTVQTTTRDEKFADSDGLSPKMPSRRSSQVSITSKNPFEEDDDVVIGKIPSEESKTTEKRNRHIKKKRRAPPPPIPIPKIICEELRVEENCKDVSEEKSTEIKDLAVEIQNFVESVDHLSEDDLKQNVERCITTEEKNLVVEKEDEGNKLIIQSAQTEITKEQTNVDDTHNTVIVGKDLPSSQAQKIICDIDNTFEKSPPTSNNNLDTENTLIEERNDFNLNNNVVAAFNETSNTSTLVKERISPDTEPIYEQPIELKITESIEDLSEKSQKSEISNEIAKEIAYVSLYDEDEFKKTNIDTENERENQKSRRRSVKEIIESINRNQKLLKINQTQNDNSTENELIKAPPRRKSNLRDKQFDQNSDAEEIKCVINEIESIARTEAQNDDFILTDDILKKLTDKINNNEEECETFKKCEIKSEVNRESSPTSSNLDWNPVPKPKRIKKLSIELQKNNTIPNDSQEN